MIVRSEPLVLTIESSSRPELTIEVIGVLRGKPAQVKDLRMKGGLQIQCTEENFEMYRKALEDSGATVSVVRFKQELNFLSFYDNYQARLTQMLDALDVAQVERLARSLLLARSDDRQIFVFGNGGSASTASHMINDLTKQRYREPQSWFRAMSLNDNIAWFSATANDYGYDQVFVRQLSCHVRAKDLVIAISSSGNSKNVLEAIRFAKSQGAETWGMVGFDGGALAREVDQVLHIPSETGDYGVMEDGCLMVNHMVCGFIAEHDKRTFGG